MSYSVSIHTRDARIVKILTDAGASFTGSSYLVPLSNVQRVISEIHKLNVGASPKTCFLGSDRCVFPSRCRERNTCCFGAVSAQVPA